MAALHAHGGGYDPRGIPDRQDVLLDAIAKDDRVWAVWRVTGTHTGTFFGIPATGRRIDVLEAGVFRIRDGTITSAWFLADELGLLQQLGIDPPLPR